MKTIFFSNCTHEREENNNTRERVQRIFGAEETSASLTLSGKDLIWKEQQRKSIIKKGHPTPEKARIFENL